MHAAHATGDRVCEGAAALCRRLKKACRVRWLKSCRATVPVGTLSGSPEKAEEHVAEKAAGQVSVQFWLEARMPMSKFRRLEGDQQAMSWLPVGKGVGVGVAARGCSMARAQGVP